MDMLRFDVVIVGAGIAGLVAALDLLDRCAGIRIGIIDKGPVGSAGSTPLAQGGLAAAVGPDDSPALHALDTIRAGDGLCDPRAVMVTTHEGPARVADLVARGARFDRTPLGALHLAREGAMSVPRSVHSADATGAEIFRALRDAASDRVTRLQGIACSLALGPQPERRVAGVWALLDGLDASAARLVLVTGRAVLLAAGGCGGLYGSTTNRDGATADGVALAYAAGATLVDLEFVQFHPTGLRSDRRAGGQSEGSASRSRRLLITEALRGAGAVLVDQSGQRFMPSLHPDAELAPRHVVAKGILDQPNGAWIDATRLGDSRLAEEFPTALRGARAHGYDLAREPVPVEPCEHYMIGGVATDLQGRTTVPGLWAAGEVACTGIHGANRVAGNSLLQSCVFAHRAARSIVSLVSLLDGSQPPRVDPTPPPFAPRTGPVDLTALRAELRAAMSAGAGPIRRAQSLDATEHVMNAAAQALGPAPAPTRDAVELANLITVGRLIVRSARLRQESRGAHWRDDFPHPSPSWEGVRLRVQRTG
ncbi:MAG: L-aspartate oxidase [Egibacteraceae bacterium]